MCSLAQLSIVDIQCTLSLTLWKTAVEVLHGINLKIKKKSITMILGPSGSGKSTLTKLLQGFLVC